MMHFEQNNFFSNFNTPKPNYSLTEIRFELEIKAQYKKASLTDQKRCLVDGKRVKQVSENNKSCRQMLTQTPL